MKEKAEIGLIGLAVMGQNLALNIHDTGTSIAVFNRTHSKTQAFLQGPASNTEIIGSDSLAAFFEVLERPRKIILMVKAGEPVDRFIQLCTPFLEPGDLVIDGGNSHFADTERRYKELQLEGIHFIGMGVSGGEEGARHGPSLMPGGAVDAWPQVKELFQKISAKVNGEPCCQWIGEGGSGHYVKMVHNGIEYGDMQLICEAYDLLKHVCGSTPEELHEIFTQWNQGPLNSYLIEITAQIFAHKEEGAYTVNRILDVAEQKGTGRWTGVNSLELGVPATMITEAVYARALSSLKEERVNASSVLESSRKPISVDPKQFIEQIKEALYAAKIISYAQGLMLLKEAAKTYGWNLNFGEIASIWRGGCIIRSQFLDNIKDAYAENPNLENLLLAPFFQKAIKQAEDSWRNVVITAVRAAIPIPCFSAGLAFFDGYRRANLPTNLLQAQRDLFGAHTYEKVDQPRGNYYHTSWDKYAVEV